MSPSTSTTSTLLFYLLFPFILASCGVICTNGYNKSDRECESNCFRKLRQGVQTCQRCTLTCSEDNNQVEVTPCTQEHNRVCHCKAGYYCPKNNSYKTYCHNQCVACAPGTFSSAPSLDSACKPYKDCAQLGMIMVKDGTTTQDRECVNATTTAPASSTPSSVITTISSSATPPPRTENKIVTRRSLENERTAAQDREFVNATTTAPTSSTPSSVITTISSNAAPPPRTEGTPQSRDYKLNESQSHWSLLLLLLFMLLIMAGFCMLMKGKSLKTLSKCLGLMNGKHEEQQHRTQIAGDHQIYSQCNPSTDYNTESEVRLGREVRGQSMGIAPQSGGAQQVTVEHNGKGENVSNTVGSIYIYSPGMVILGSNSGDKKQEAGVCDETRPLISAPQQESNPPSQDVRIRMSAQEVDKEELSLSFPVPATGK